MVRFLMFASTVVVSESDTGGHPVIVCGCQTIFMGRYSILADVGCRKRTHISLHYLRVGSTDYLASHLCYYLNSQLASLAKVC